MNTITSTTSPSTDNSGTTSSTSSSSSSSSPLAFGPGNAICYSGYRCGQSPQHGLFPSLEEITEDLLILSKNWSFLRLYDCSEHALRVLAVIASEGLDFKVMLGANMTAEVSNPGCPWGAHYSEETLLANQRANSEEIDAVIDLAQRYPQLVFSVSVGNEASVDWSDHLVPVPTLIGYVQRVKQAISQPVTFCENYVPWTDKLAPLVQELDFISVHSYPVWEYKSIDEALAYTQENYRLVAAHNPGKTIVITEAGWTTAANGRGMEAWNASQELQARYYRELLDWTDKAGILTFVFEAFDEPWKGGDDPLEPEKHWGLFTVDRQPKLLMRDLYPELLRPANDTANSEQCRRQPSGEFVTRQGQRFYVIHDVDAMAPFFISLVSDSDHWMFIASNGALTAGRVSPDTALFPYTTVDKIYDSCPHTGSKTLIHCQLNGQSQLWEPFNRELDSHYNTSRNLYKNTLGNTLLFEEVNHDLQLVFRLSWHSSADYGFCRQCEVENIGGDNYQLELLDGLQNILPAGTPQFTQTNSSYLVDAYKWSELDEATGLGLFALASGITDRAEPCESLRASTVFCLGLEQRQLLLSSTKLEAFRRGQTLQQESHKRGVRGAYWVHSQFSLAANDTQRWQLVANIEQSQSQVVSLLEQLEDPTALAASIAASIEQGSDALSRIMAAGDGFQTTAEEQVAVHHYANVQFNILRGGIFSQQYQLNGDDFSASVKRFNSEVYQRHQGLLQGLAPTLDRSELQAIIKLQNDPQLQRLSYEYLPLTFGRRHGDPSRPWNDFAIKLQDKQGNKLLCYEGNWRDIFQNWEALLFGYPEFIENVIAKFVNASTADGYNPYRITEQGIDWEVEELDNPWSYIGYWGDHQIIYLQKLLELSQQFHPGKLVELLHQPLFSYANVPYKIKPFTAMLRNAKDTVLYDTEQAARIEQRVAAIGADGKLLADAEGQVYQVNLLEKLLVPLLSKLANLVVDGGIWLNTQRPEWNDANNALVGQGLSMVTLYYMRRYIAFLQQLLAGLSGQQAKVVELSQEVAQWLVQTSAALQNCQQWLDDSPLSAQQRYSLLAELGEAASSYREALYRQQSFSGTTTIEVAKITELLRCAQAAIEHSIQFSRRDDGLHNAYNTLEFSGDKASVKSLYPMLEGQVAVLSSGAMSAAAAVELLDTLYSSELFRADQDSFLLYPDRRLPSFLQKNCVPLAQIQALPVVASMLQLQDTRLLECDSRGQYRFNAELTNVDALNSVLEQLAPQYGEALQTAAPVLRQLYEQVFNHKAFTGRSGGMFGFEGLGSIYWHMVSKLLLAVQESFFRAGAEAERSSDVQRLAHYYYRVRAGIGFNKSPAEYGAFPTDPYSHTPSHIGAQQPGMTGQVKEEMMARFGELGLRVAAGEVHFDVSLLRQQEFLSETQDFRFLTVADQWHTIAVSPEQLAFSWCQLPIVYRLLDTEPAALTVFWADGRQQVLPTLVLPLDIAKEIFTRSGVIQKVELAVPRSALCQC